MHINCEVEFKFNMLKYSIYSEKKQPRMPSTACMKGKHDMQLTAQNIRWQNYLAKHDPAKHQVQDLTQLSLSAYETAVGSE